MFVALIGKNEIYKTTLPKNQMGTYYITNKEGKKIINIDGFNGAWIISSNNHVKITNKKSLDKENQISSITLKPYQQHWVYLTQEKQWYILYCAPVLEEYIELNLKTTGEISIGKDEKNHIQYSHPLIKKTQAKIFHSVGVLLIENYDLNFGTFVNNKPVTKKKKIVYNGDVIFIMGLKIIIMGNKVFINNPFDKVKFDEEKFFIETEEISYQNLKEEDDSEIQIYQETDYFARAPRIASVIEREKIRIDAPPQVDKKQGMPLLYVMGSSLMMGMMSVISMISAIDGLRSGTATVKDTIFSMAMSGTLFLSMILIPVLDVKYQKKEKRKYEETRQIRYRKYLNSKIRLINKIMDKQRKILRENYITAENCANLIINKEPRLWERKVEDADFLRVRLGMGNLPLEADIEYPEEQFTMEDDDLLEILKNIANEAKILEDVPVTISLVEKNIVALVTKNENEKQKRKFIQNLIMQLVSLHSYTELKLVFLLEENDDLASVEWDYMKMLPHLWDNTKQIRFFGKNHQERQEICQYLEMQLNYRLSIQEEVDYQSFMPYYLIITDNYKKIEKLNFIEEITNLKKNMGFSIFCITNNFIELPNECKTFISIEGKNARMFDREISSQNQNEFVLDDSPVFFFEKIAKELANIPIKTTASKEMALPNNYTFLEMYDVGRIEALNILERWRENDSCASLQAPIGTDGSGMPIVLDIHEKAHGPHGLIAGSTGSGKSEFIITYILSLAINYHPDDVVFVLIDYKGGGLAGAFQKKDSKLPHLVGTITNIDTVGLQRSLASIQSELRKRQILFNQAREKTDEGTIDIYKYQKLYHEGIVEKPIPHLLIICDEFAELKQQQEDFMDELISVARIGRSLGVHLILATQKPAGIVNDQIRSNSKFGICLKVQEPEDSQDVIKRPDAANLKQAGQFYMQVGNNEYFTLGQSAYSGAPYYPADNIKKSVDNSIGFISNIGRTIKKIDNTKKEKINKEGEQLTNIVKYLSLIAKKENIEPEKLWIEDIPETIFVQDLRKKYKVKKEEGMISAIVGEYDDPFNQRQGVLKFNLSQSGNTIIFGNAESGKETLLATMVYDLITNYQANEMQLYLLDFGTEALKIFKNSPQVGDVVFMQEAEKINRFFEMLQKEIMKRTTILSNYGGDYNLYVKTGEEEMPMKVVVINGYESFSENYEDEYEDIFLSLSRDGSKCGIVFIITASTPSDIRYRLSQNFKQKVAMQLNDEDEYANVFDGVGKKKPSHLFGRGLVKLEDIYEFQTAKICEPANWNFYIKETIKKLQENQSPKAEAIPTLPSQVKTQDIIFALEGLEKVPLGIDKKTLEIATYNFTKNMVTIVSSKNMEMCCTFILNLLKEIKELTEVTITLLDAEGELTTGKSDILQDYQNFILGMENNQNEKVLCVIAGIDKLLNKLEDEDIDFLEDLKKAERQGNYYFILLDNTNKVKDHEYDDWYKEYVTGDTGIWVGKGVDEQYLFNISNQKEIDNNCGKSFAHVIEEGELRVVKLLEIKEKSE